MLSVKVHYDNGDTILTRINGNPEEVARYYLGIPVVVHEDFGTGKETYATAEKVEFLDNCATFENFGCIWAVDCFYLASKEDINKYSLLFNVRYKAHVIKCCKGYKGTSEISAGAFSVYDGRKTA